MYLREASSLPADFAFGNTFKDLGLFVNEHDQPRSIDAPEQPFNYFISPNDRYIERHKEAFQACLQEEIVRRLTTKEDQNKWNMELEFLPKSSGPRVPILTTPRSKQGFRRVILYIGDCNADLGILSGRLISEEGIKVGSLLDWIEHVRSCSKDLGIVIANPGQLVWHRRSQRAMTWSSWNALGRPSALSPSLKYTDKNRIPRNEDEKEHLRNLLEDVIKPLLVQTPQDKEEGSQSKSLDDNSLREPLKLDIIVESNSLTPLVELLQEKFTEDGEDSWEWLPASLSSINYTGSITTLDQLIDDLDFKIWFGEHARGYVKHPSPLYTPLPDDESELSVCPVFSAGEHHHAEEVFLRTYKHILKDLEARSQVSLTHAEVPVRSEASAAAFDTRCQPAPTAQPTLHPSHLAPVEDAGTAAVQQPTKSPEPDEEPGTKTDRKD